MKKRPFHSYPFWIKLATALIFLIAYWGITEIVLTLFKTKTIGDETEYYLAQAFSKEEWATAKKVKATLKSLGKDRVECIPGTVIYRYHPVNTELVNINSQGFRGPEILPKTDGEIRIIITGASLAFGTLADDNHSLGPLLEADLAKAYPGKKITVYNLGIEGYEFQRDMALVNLLSKKIQPDLVLFLLTSNDLYQVYGFGYQPLAPFTSTTMDTKLIFQQTINRIVESEDPALIDRSRMIGVVRQERFSLPSAASITPAVAPVLSDQKKEFAVSYGTGLPADMAKAADTLAKEGIAAEFVFVPGLFDKHPRTPVEDVFAAIFAVIVPDFALFYHSAKDSLSTNISNYPHLRYYDLIEMYDGKETTYFDVVHLNGAGMRILADNLVGIIEKSGIIDR